MARGGKAHPRDVLRRYLQTNVWPKGQAERAGLVYRGPAAFVLEHGEWFAPRASPARYKLGAPGRCYGNAIAAAAFYGLGYVEGYAVDPGTKRAVFAHAWNVDADGGLVDTTWAPVVAVVVGPDSPVLIRGMSGLAYLGVRFSVERADDSTWNGDACVLDDWKRRWPLLRERWSGESPRATWPEASPALRALRAERDGHSEAALEAWAQAEAEAGAA